MAGTTQPAMKIAVKMIRYFLMFSTLSYSSSFSSAIELAPAEPTSDNQKTGKINCEES